MGNCQICEASRFQRAAVGLERATKISLDFVLSPDSNIALTAYRALMGIRDVTGSKM